LLGLGGGAGGTSFSLNPGTNANQVNTAYNQNQALLTALQGQNGLGNQSQVYNQLQNVAAGQGPNPAQAMLNQATGANVANQAALQAGQRGASQNVGLAARNAALAGTNAQQQAAGQGATMQANQALGALGQAGQLANTQAGQQIGATQNEQNILQNANTAYNQQQAGLAQTQMQGQQSMLSGVLGGIGALGGTVGNVAKGISQGMADGGLVPNQMGVQSMFGQSLANQPMSSGGNVGEKLKAGGHVPGQAKVKGDSLKNDSVKALLSPGEVVIPRSVMNSKDPIRGAAQFVQSVMAKKKARK
jgi:hypothetical protein